MPAFVLAVEIQAFFFFLVGRLHIYLFLVHVSDEMAPPQSSLS
jgi:hypothetical protein